MPAKVDEANLRGVQARPTRALSPQLSVCTEMRSVMTGPLGLWLRGSEFHYCAGGCPPTEAVDDPLMI